MFRFAETDNVILLLVLPFFALLLLYGHYRKKQALHSFAGVDIIPFLTSSLSLPKRRLKTVLLFLALFFLVLVMMRPQGDPVEREVTKRGRDLVFVIDVSRSMLAEDLKPNRLGRAKQIVSDVVDILEGERVALLVFAGSSAVKCPLTLDYNYFKNTLNRIDVNDVSRGGTLLGDAIRTVSERLFYDQDNTYRDIILITDGEDHESFPVEAAQTAAKRGIRIHTVGLGDPDGANIPIREGSSYNLLKYNEQVVKSRLDEETLKKIAEITEGVFIPVRTDLVDLAYLYENYIATAEKREAESKESKIWRELFQFFLGIVIVLLMIESLVSDRVSHAD